jgi:alpha-galactosidase
MDDAVNSMHSHIRKIFMPLKNELRNLICAGIGPECVMSEEATRKAMDGAAKIGAELFWIDAGWYAESGLETEWFAHVGDWKPTKSRYPGGLDKLREYCHSLGMKFGLWAEPERLGIKSAIRQKHPEWIQRKYDGDINEAGHLDLGIPECAEWVKSALVDIITDNKLDFLKLDFNTSTNGSRENSGYRENNWVRYNEALYSIFKELRERFPNVIFHTCAAGGGRTDLGMVKHFYFSDVSDMFINPVALRVTNGMTIALPPEFIIRGTGSAIFANKTSDVYFQYRAGLFTQTVVAPLLPTAFDVKPNDKQIDIIKRTISLYKDFVRPFINESKIYHHTPEIELGNNTPAGIIELDAKDGARGITGIFKISSIPEEEITLKLRGVDPEKNYRVTFDNTRATTTVHGYDLMYKGVSLRLDGALTSELLLYEAVN